MSVLLTVGPRCTLAASHADLRWVTVSIPIGQTDGQTYRRQTVAVRFPLWMRQRNSVNEYEQLVIGEHRKSVIRLRIIAAWVLEIKALSRPVFTARQKNSTSMGDDKLSTAVCHRDTPPSKQFFWTRASSRHPGRIGLVAVGLRSPMIRHAASYRPR